MRSSRSSAPIRRVFALASTRTASSTTCDRCWTIRRISASPNNSARYSSLPRTPPSRSSASPSSRSNFAPTHPPPTPSAFTSKPSEPRHALFARALQHHHHVEERIAVQLPPHSQLFDKLLERHILMRIRAQARLPHTPQQLRNVSRFVKLGPQRQRVDEEADQPFRSARVRVGNGRADDHDPTVPCSATARSGRRRARS